MSIRGSQGILIWLFRNTRFDQLHHQISACMHVGVRASYDSLRSRRRVAGVRSYLLIGSSAARGVALVGLVTNWRLLILYEVLIIMSHMPRNHIMSGRLRQRDVYRNRQPVRFKAMTEIMCLRMKRMPESTAIFSVEAAGQVYNQTNEFVCLAGNINHNADLSIEVNRCIHNTWCSFWKYTFELYDRPSAPLELEIRMLKSRGTRGNAVRLRQVEPARAPLRHAAPSPPELPDSLHRLAKGQSHGPPDFLFGHAYEDWTGSENIE